MSRVPKGWMFTIGLSALAVVAALTATTLKRADPVTDTYEVEADSCFRYGRLECCVKE